VALYKPNSTAIARGTVAGLTLTSTRSGPTIKAKDAYSTTPIPPADQAQLNMQAAAAAWAALPLVYQQMWQQIAAVSGIVVDTGGSGYTAPPQIAHLFSTFSGSVTGGGAGYADSPVVTLSGGGATPIVVQLIAVGDAVAIISDNLQVWLALSPPTCTVSGGTGSGCVVTAAAIEPNLYQLTIEDGGTGYAGADVYAAGYADPLGGCLVTGGAVTAMYITAPVGWTGYAPPVLTVTSSQGSGAAVAGVFYPWPYTLPIYQAVLTAGALSGVNILNYGNQVPNLPAAVVSGGVEVVTSYTVVTPSTTPTFSSTGAAIQVFDFTLSAGPVAGATFVGFSEGMLVFLILRMPTIGSWDGVPYTFAWPSNVPDAPAFVGIPPGGYTGGSVPAGVQTVALVVDASSLLLPQEGVY
jgi:hypothetical protein